MTGEPASAGPRCGFVALLGAPNSGKSTLINALTGAKVSIVSPKVQTTRTRVLGIVMVGDRPAAAQVVLVDTPGIFVPKRRLDRAMIAAAWQGAANADLVALLVDARRCERQTDPDTARIVEGLLRNGRRAVLLLNKIDLLKRDRLLAIADRLNGEGPFSDIFMISALTGSGTGDFLAHCAARLPAGPHLFPEDRLSDMPERLLAAEITREKLYLNLHEELPYALTVETESWEERRDGSVKIEQTVYVRRDSQKSIVLGKGGQQVKKIGAAAREELELLFDRRVHLFLFVKVRDKWQHDPARYRDWGLDFSA